MSEKKRILIVDDNAVIRRILREELRVGDYIVDEADSGEKTLEMISGKTVPDLITMDVGMPGLSGFELFKTLLSEPYRKYFSHLPDQRPPVVFISSYDSIQDRRKGFELGATNFITKPFSRGQVLSVVNKILYPKKLLGSLLALVVDDSKIARAVVTKALEQEGIHVIEAEDGLQAFEIICKHMSDLDIVITDLKMPVMDGRQLVEKIRKELDLKDLPVLFLTAETDNTRLLELFECGGSDYLIKPFVKEELMARLMVHLEHRELTVRLKNSVKELSDLSRMKDDLIAVCSHDLRSPLHGMLGFIDLLAQKAYIKDEDREGLEEIKASGSYLLELINDILDLSKIQSGGEDLSMQPLNASHLAQACYKAMKNMADSKQVNFSFQDDCPNAIISGNRSALMRAINNLLSNAIKFTPSGKSVALKISLNDQEQKGRQLAVIVSDTGIGIEESMISTLFDKYSRSSRQGTKGEKGTGLGMSIVKEIVRLHDGDIQVESLMGKGSVFTLTLPFMQGDEPDTCVESTGSDSAVPENRSSVKSCHILLVEDNPVNVKFTTQILERSGHRVSHAQTGWAAMADVMAEAFDLIFMDIEMPELDGFSASEKIRELGITEVPIIAFTSLPIKEIEAKYISAGMNDYLIKPIKPAYLTDMVKKWIKNESI